MRRARDMCRWLSWMGVVALAVLSWTPGHYMVSTVMDLSQAFPGAYVPVSPGLFRLRPGIDTHLEHAAPYLVVSAVAGIGYRGRWGYLPIAAFFCTYAGVLELGKMIVPGRHARLDDVAASAAGALLGVSLIWLWSTYRRG